MRSFICKIKNNKVLKYILLSFLIQFLVSYIFSIPSFSARGNLHLISYVLMGLLLGVTFLYTILYTKVTLNKHLIVPACFVVFAGLGTIIYSHEFRTWLTLILMFITMLTFYYAFSAINNSSLVLKIICISFFLFAIYFCIHYRSDIAHLNISSARLGSYFDNVNSIGFYFSIGYSLSLYIGLFFKKKIDLLFLVAAVVFLFLGFFTGSRAFIVVVVVGTIVIIFIRLKKHLFFAFLTAAIFITLFIILINMPFLAYIKDQIDRAMFSLFGIGNYRGDTSTVQRVTWPRYAFYLGGKHLFTGLGCGGFGIYSGVGTYAHNNFAEVMCDFGLIGFILYYSCFVFPLLLSFKRKGEAEIVPLLFFVYLTRSFFGVTYYSKEAYIVIALCFYLVKDYKLSDFRIMANSKKNSKNAMVLEI